MATKIMVDAGHFAGYNKPANYPTYCEGDRMWVLAQYLVSALKEYGFTVGQTRSSVKDYPKTEDGKDSVYTRGQKAKGYDLLLSLHSNACDTETVNRAVILHPMNGKSVGIAEKIGKSVKTTMGVSSYQLLQRDYNTGNYISDGKAHSGMDYYGVIRGAVAVGTPAIIIEHGFHTNNAVAKWLMQDANLKKLAEAEAQTLAEHYGLKKDIYRVQVGAFHNKSLADTLCKELKNRGYKDAFVVKK